MNGNVLRIKCLGEDENVYRYSFEFGTINYMEHAGIVKINKLELKDISHDAPVTEFF